MVKFRLKEFAFAAFGGLAIAGLGAVGPASGADMTPKPQPMAPINWTG
jgi:hypothetical protein